MATEIKVPTLGESVTEAIVAQWLKKVGDSVAADEPLVELETDKVTLEVNAPGAGVLTEISAEEGAEVAVGALLGMVDAAGAAAAASTAQAAQPVAAAAPEAPVSAGPQSGPAARKLMAENDLTSGQIDGTGKDGRVTKGDVLAHLEKPAPAAAPVEASTPPAPVTPPVVAPPPAAPASSGPRARADKEERVRMTKLRRTIAQRLKDAQNTAAMLTTFNEVDMSNLLALRNQHKERFEKKHGIKLGFMSWFVKASVAALQDWPAVNGEIDGTDLVYKNYYDVGVAVSTPTGLMVPVVRDCDAKSFAQIEKDIASYGKAAREGKIAMSDLTGGTFTITNGGVFGSLMSTPILNPPQSGILGMHKTQERPVAVNGKVEVRPMMYLALSYDHRIIDGREAVSFLVRVKECIENPERILLDT